MTRLRAQKAHASERAGAIATVEAFTRTIRPLRASLTGRCRTSPAAVVCVIALQPDMANMEAKRYLWLALPLILLGCDANAGADRFRPVADVQQLMLTIIEPAAEVYWDAVGWVLEPEGTQEIRPENDEEWEEVLNAAYVVAESGNLLMMDGRVMDGPWIPMSQAMIEVARRAIAAAEARDEEAVFNVGAELYYTCTACHSQYAIDAVRPNVLIPE